MALEKVLVVDDDPSICDVLRMYLENDGYSVILSYDGEEALVKFKVGAMGLSPINIELEGFELAGEDGVFYPALGRVCNDKRYMLVKCPEVPNPVAVRYGMRNWSVATVFNCSGIPLSPFRTDDWK